MRECWAIYWLEIPEGQTEEFTAVMTGNGNLPPKPKDVPGEFMTCDIQIADTLIHLYWHERMTQESALTLARINYQNGDIGAQD